MMGLCNILSGVRGPLALFFLNDEAVYRFIGIFLAMITDILDGYLARRFQCTSQFGAMLDPVMDRVFVLFSVGVLVGEGRLETVQVIAMLSRDLALFIFGIYLVISGGWSRCQLQALWCGKATTTLQFLVLMSIVLGFSVPPQVFSLFALLGCLALVELVLTNRQSVA